jgi:hypothetical protein
MAAGDTVQGRRRKDGTLPWELKPADFHVGSSLTEKRGWRDVDVRLILDDDEFEPYADAGRRRMHELAWTAFGSQMTGLPIDFQIQQQAAANDEFSGVRSALLLYACELPIVRREV